MSLQAIVIGAAPCSSLDFLRPYRGEHDLIFCADGGLQTALRCGLKPDWYAGDNDSGGTCPPDVESWVLPSEKDLTDLEMTLHQALRVRPSRILLCGCTGGRQDHHLANLGLLEWLSEQGTPAMILDEGNEISFLTPGTYHFINQPSYRYFSILPADRILGQLTIQGAKYPLPGRNIRRGTTLTVSNEFLSGQDVTISFTEGGAYLIRSR